MQSWPEPRTEPGSGLANFISWRAVRDALISPRPLRAPEQLEEVGGGEGEREIQRERGRERKRGRERERGGERDGGSEIQTERGREIERERVEVSGVTCLPC